MNIYNDKFELIDIWNSTKNINNLLCDQLIRIRWVSCDEDKTQIIIIIFSYNVMYTGN